MKKPFLLCLMAGLCLNSMVAQDKAPNPDWPKGIDPATLALNEEPEPAFSGDGFIELFNGKDLTGWVVLGGEMPFVVNNGEIVGTCVKGVHPNSYLCTEKTYTDFIFTTEFKWDIPGNSGIMFRAGAREPDKKGIRRVYGCQSEMDPTERGWTGGIYGEAMKGWIYPLSRTEEHEKARKAVQELTEWNRMTIYARRNVLRTWINGVPCAYSLNDLCKEGFFGLQVHQGPEGTIRWRNIRVKELHPATD